MALEFICHALALHKHWYMWL